jgi:hypothetical protein
MGVAERKQGTKKEKKLQEKWEEKLHNCGLGMDRGLSGMVYGHEYSLPPNGKVGGGRKKY